MAWEDLGARPYAWLPPDFVPPPPSPCLAVKDTVAQTYRILVGPHLIDAEFRAHLWGYGDGFLCSVLGCS